MKTDKTTKPTGGPAFPNRGDNQPGFEIYDGMDLRDWFAGQALAGIMSDKEADFGPTLNAIEAYAQADAMLERRET